jgi:hypothetical protein
MSAKRAAAGKGEHKSVTRNQINQLLCLLCSKAGTCLQAKNCVPSMPHCEQFVFSGPTHNRAHELASGMRRSLSKRKSAPRAARDESSPGLCRTCRKRNVCELPKPLGGVWHCQEFQ